MRARHVLPDSCLPPARRVDATGTIRCLFSDIDGGSGALEFFPCLVSMLRRTSTVFVFRVTAVYSCLWSAALSCTVVAMCLFGLSQLSLRSACTHTHRYHTLVMNPPTYIHTCIASLKLCLLTWGWKTATCMGHRDVDVVFPVTFETFVGELRISPAIVDNRP